jgi:hypothetical protein
MQNPTDQPRAVRLPRAVILALTAAATIAAILESYVGLYEWALRHGLGHWAQFWPLLIDTPIVAGELMLLVGFVAKWSWARKALPWALVIAGLAASVAGNFYHLRAADVPTRATSAAAPLVACVMLAATLMLLKWTGQPAADSAVKPDRKPAQTVTPARPARQQSTRRAAPSLTLAADAKYIRQLRELKLAGQPLPSERHVAAVMIGNPNARKRAKNILHAAQNGGIPQ